MKRNSCPAWQLAYHFPRRFAVQPRTAGNTLPSVRACLLVLCSACWLHPAATAQETAVEATTAAEPAEQLETPPAPTRPEPRGATDAGATDAGATDAGATDASVADGGVDASAANPKHSEQPAQPSVSKSSLAPALALSRAFRESAQKALPTVVTVFCRTKDASAANPVLGIIGGERAQKFDSVGSGVIISGDGLILTNHHVVADAEVIEVRLQDGRQFRAENPKSDPQSDVAIVKINVREELPAAEIGKSDDLHVGDWVMAIGSPFMIESSVSAGIISGTGRYQTLSRDVKGQFLQTDAAINPGNSGGPLLDLDGRVVGINTAISSRTGGFEGIGFAIPIDRAMWIKSELAEYGTVRRGYAGLRASSVPYELARKLDLPENSGTMVNSVVFDRPAAKAGLLPGDVIINLAGARVQSNASFAELVQQSPIGQPLPITVIRDGERVELQLELVADPRN